VRIASKQLASVIIGAALSIGAALFSVPVHAQSSSSGAVGVEGTISAPAPTQAATITNPSDGQNFTSLPITVSGICPKGLLVKLFKNNVFSGSQQCTSGSYSIAIDLFRGNNELVARVYDALDQSGPDSNKVSVEYTETVAGASAQVTLTSNYAKRGANPGQELSWPIILSGGVGPYAISIDWGDGKPADLISLQFAGEFTIKHKYDNPGVYNIIVKASDKDGGVAYLQLVGVGNGALKTDGTGVNGSGGAGGAAGAGGAGTGAGLAEEAKVRILWQPATITVPFILATFWLGKRYELKLLRKKIEQGIHPFK
jgi:hypothetical protein